MEIRFCTTYAVQLYMCIMLLHKLDSLHTYVWIYNSSHGRTNVSATYDSNTAVHATTKSTRV